MYFAFVAPNGPGPLTSIDIEDGAPVQTAPPEPVIQADRRKSRTPTATIPAPFAPVTTVPAGPPQNVVAETPSGSQYQGAVDLILSRVNRAP